MTIEQDGTILRYSERLTRIAQFTVDTQSEYTMRLLFFKGRPIAACDIFLTEDEFIANLQHHFEKYSFVIDQALLRKLEFFGFLPQGGLLDSDHELSPILKPIVTDPEYFSQEDVESLFERYEHILQYHRQNSLLFEGSIDLAGVAPSQISKHLIDQNEKKYPTRLYLYSQIDDFERFYFLAGDRLLKGIAYYLEKIEELKKIVTSESTKESILQNFLEHNFWIWGFEYNQAIPKQQLGEKYEIDFLLKKLDGKSEIVEIERANLRLFTKNLDPTKELTHAIRQVRDYQSFCIRNYNYLSVESGVNVFAPKGHVILGRECTSTEQEKLDELNNSHPNIEVYTYNYLIAKATSFVEVFKNTLVGQKA